MLDVRFRDSLGGKMVTVVAIQTSHRVSTYHLPEPAELSAQVRHRSTTREPVGHRDAALDCRKVRAETAKGSTKIDGKKVIVSLFYTSKIYLDLHCHLCASRGGGVMPPSDSYSQDQAGRSSGRETTKGCRES